MWSTVCQHQSPTSLWHWWHHLPVSLWTGALCLSARHHHRCQPFRTLHRRSAVFVSNSCCISCLYFWITSGYSNVAKAVLSGTIWRMRFSRNCMVGHFHSPDLPSGAHFQQMLAADNHWRPVFILSICRGISPQSLIYTPKKAVSCFCVVRRIPLSGILGKIMSVFWRTEYEVFTSL